MDWSLIAVLGGMLDLLSTVGSYALTILIVAVTLGLVIFVHELGHFVVAKLCGVKVEKFYLGFDIYGLKLFRFRRGETEYGIGILPLGGYVKMLGQEDNPARLRDEIERAKQKPHAALQESPLAASQETPCDAACEETIDHAEQALYDPRSYLAKSVPRRMAIISAGVAMNLVFAFVCATVAYRIGVRQFPCGVGDVNPGMGAWQIGLQPDDEILEIAGKPMHNFEDLRKAVALGDNVAAGLPIVVRRPGVEEPLELTVTADKSHGLPLIGISNPRTTALWKAEDRGSFPAWPGSPAAQAEPAFEPGDRVVALDGRPVELLRDIQRYFALHAGKPVEVTVLRSPQPDGDADGTPRSEQRLTITVAPAPMLRLGLVMRIGPVAAVQAGSPAVEAGIRPGDLIVQIDDEVFVKTGDRKPSDPMTLPDRLRGRAGETVAIVLRRPDASGKRSETIHQKVTLREPDGFAVPGMSISPLDVPALGLAYYVTNTVESVIPGSPAEKAGLAPDDVVTAATIIPPNPLPDGLPFKPEEQTVEFTETRPAWPMLLYKGLANNLPGTTVRLTWTRDEKEHSGTLAPYASDDWFHVDRGFVFQPEYFYQTAGSLGEAVVWGLDETVEATLTVYRFLQKLTSRDISPRMMAGPIGIIGATMQFAERGLTDLLIFVTLLSANLAVVNFLPIPLLDGGHMVFLAYEGIRGKPADERVQTVLTYIGLFLLLTLLVWVFGLDLGLISREVP